MNAETGELVPMEFLSREQQALYVEYIVGGQRRGQAFFNVLDQESRDRLRQSSADPFYKRSDGGSDHIIAAVEFLTAPTA